MVATESERGVETMTHGGTGSGDPLQSQLRELRHALTTVRGTAEVGRGTVRVEVSADGSLDVLHIDKSAMTVSAEQLASVITRLYREARADAVEASREALSKVKKDLRFAEILASIEDATNAPVPRPQEPTSSSTDDDKPFSRSILQRP